MASQNTHYAGDGRLGRWLSRGRRIHFIGIYGVSMRVLAAMCAERGYTVTGSDDAQDALGALSLGGAEIAVSPPSPDGAIIDADLAVYSTAVGKDHKEMRAARELGIPLVSRADLLGELMKDYGIRVGISGTHGKSTTSAMCGGIFEKAGFDPTLVVGARLAGRMDGYRPGGRRALVFEACEYCESFLCFSPTVAVVTNAEWEHPDCFPDRAASIASFRRYLSLPSVKVAVVNADDEGACEAAEGLAVPILLFGRQGRGDLLAEDVRLFDGGSEFTLSFCGRELGRIRLSVPGMHNVENALAAAGAALLSGVDAMSVVLGLGGFLGIGRRTEYRGTLDGVRYFDDYAHHPTEIRAALRALRGEGRLIVVYQPHTYSRTVGLFSGICDALSLADAVVLVDIFAAREENESGITCRQLADAIGERAVSLPTPEVAALHLLDAVRPGDTVVVMGAGSIADRFFTGRLSFSDTPI